MTEQWAVKVDRATNDPERIERRKSIAPVLTVPRSSDVDDMEDIIDGLLMRRKSGKYIAQTLAKCGFGRLPTND